MSSIEPAAVRRDTLYAAMIIAACVFAVGMAFELRSLVDHDVAFQLYAALQLLQGRELYVDIYEFNLPPAYYLYVPAAWLATHIGLDINTVFRLLTALLALVCVIFSAWLVYRLPGIRDNRRFVAIPALLALALAFYVSAHFGQRDHLLLLLLLPYVMLRVAESVDPPAPMPLLLLVAIGLAAGFACTVKPHYVVVPLALETARMWRIRRLPFDACNLALVAAGAIMLVEFLVWHGADYTALLPIIVSTTFDATHSFRGFLYFHIDALISFALMGVVLFGARAKLAKPFEPALLAPLRTLALAAGAAFLAGVLQQKFWNYHFVPWQALCTIWLGIALLALRRPEAAPGRLARGLRITVSIALALVVLTGIANLVLRNFGKYYRHGYFIEQVFAKDLHAGDGIMFLSPSITPNFYLVLKHDLEWTSRFPSIWPLTHIAQGRICIDGDACDKPFVAGFVRDTVTEDLLGACPQHVFVLESGLPSYGWTRDFTFDTIGFFSRDPDFARAWRNYTFAGSALHEDSRRIYRHYMNETGRCD